MNTVRFGSDAVCDAGNGRGIRASSHAAEEGWEGAGDTRAEKHLRRARERHSRAARLSPQVVGNALTANERCGVHTSGPALRRR